MGLAEPHNNTAFPKEKDMSILYFKTENGYKVVVIGQNFSADIPCKDIGEVFDTIRKLRGEKK